MSAFARTRDTSSVRLQADSSRSNPVRLKPYTARSFGDLLRVSGSSDEWAGARPREDSRRASKAVPEHGDGCKCQPQCCRAVSPGHFDAPRERDSTIRVYAVSRCVGHLVNAEEHAVAVQGPAGKPESS